jgi:hypothetical protein
MWTGAQLVGGPVVVSYLDTRNSWHMVLATTLILSQKSFEVF